MDDEDDVITNKSIYFVLIQFNLYHLMTVTVDCVCKNMLCFVDTVGYLDKKRYINTDYSENAYRLQSNC